jgi:prepilin-type N-terminal cleavage/methylation domain-containing protein
MRRMHTTHVAASPGFSLVEVVLALAVVAVGLITIIGLFPQGLSSARRAMDDSFCAMVAQDVIAQRRVLIQSGGATIGGPTVTEWYTGEGTNTTDATIAMYKCEVRSIPLTVGLLEQTEVRVYWPWYRSATPANTQTQNTNIFVTMIAKYR